MGSFAIDTSIKLTRLSALGILLLFAVNGSAAHAGGESLLLPGYVMPRGTTPPLTVGTQALPTVLPGWAKAKPGFALQPNRSGLKLIIDNSWPDLPGYRMVRIEFLANSIDTEDRKLKVQIKFQTSNYGRALMTVTSDEIVLPAGQSAVKYQLYFPSQSQPRIHEVRTTEDGEAWSDLSCTINTYTGQSNVSSLAYLDLTGLRTNALAVNSNVNVNGAIGFSAAPGYVNQGDSHEYRSGDTFAYPVNSGWSGIRADAELPNNPLGYACFNTVFCFAEQLETLREDYPAQWTALRSWVATGGKLLVWPGQRNNAESTLQTQLKLDRLFPHGEGSASETPSASWNDKKISATPDEIKLQQNNYNGNRRFANPAEPAPLPGNFNNPNGALGRQRDVVFPERDWFQGTLTVVSDDQRVDAIYAHLHNATQQPLPATPMPKVGLPPITMFQVLITLFVILIGPVNYFYFKQKKKMNWLLLTVPAGALAITVLLLAYTLLKDGIGVRAWPQSYTVLDQVQKLAATRQQLCLFAGVTPGDGLRFRPQTKFDDLSEDHTTNYNYRYRDSRNWDYSWDQPTDGSSGISGSQGITEQHFRSGWLPARTRKLYETCEFDACQRELQIQITGDSCQLANKLGSKVLAVYVADPDRVWNATEIAEEASASGSLLDKSQLQNLQKSLETLVHLDRPIDFDENLRSLLPTQDKTAIERFMGLRKLHPRVYLAVVERWPDLQFGVANSTVESWGPHIILGVW